MNYAPLRQLLDAEQKRIEGELTTLREVDASLREEGGAPDSGGIGNHLADDGSQTYDLERSFALQENLELLLVEVQRALHKFENGTYGTCDDCGQEIPYERLEALPHASLCVPCKSRREKVGAR